jgi:hypothetical protein
MRVYYYRNVALGSMVELARFGCWPWCFIGAYGVMLGEHRLEMGLGVAAR